MIKQFILKRAVENGDAEIIKHGKVPMGYVEELETVMEDIGEIDSDEEEIERQFDQIWKKVADKVGLDINECLLSVSKIDGEVEEIVLINEQLHTDMVESGETIRLKSDLE